MTAKQKQEIEEIERELKTQTYAHTAKSRLTHIARRHNAALTWCGIAIGQSWTTFKAIKPEGRKCKRCLAISEIRRDAEGDERLEALLQAYASIS